MKLYRKALPLEIVDGVGVWPLEYLTPIEVTKKEIEHILITVENDMVKADEDVSIQEVRKATTLAIYKLYGGDKL